MHGVQNRQQSFNSPRSKAAPLHTMAINSPRKARDKARHFLKRAFPESLTASMGRIYVFKDQVLTRAIL